MSKKRKNKFKKQNKGKALIAIPLALVAGATAFVGVQHHKMYIQNDTKIEAEAPIEKVTLSFYNADELVKTVEVNKGEVFTFNEESTGIKLSSPLECYVANGVGYMTGETLVVKEELTFTVQDVDLYQIKVFDGQQCIGTYDVDGGSLLNSSGIDLAQCPGFECFEISSGLLQGAKITNRFPALIGAESSVRENNIVEVQYHRNENIVKLNNAVQVLAEMGDEFIEEFGYTAKMYLHDSAWVGKLNDTYIEFAFKLFNEDGAMDEPYLAIYLSDDASADDIGYLQSLGNYCKGVVEGNIEFDEATFTQHWNNVVNCASFGEVEKY